MGGGDGHHDVIQTLIDNHTAIERRVVDLPNGVETWTESDDPAMAAEIRTHVRQMATRLEEGRPVRRWDPLFAAIFENYEAIEMVMTDTPRGIHVVETSADPQVVALIQQHAHRAVSEFVRDGRARYMQPTPLPGEDTATGTHPMQGHAGGGMHATAASAPQRLPAFEEAQPATADLFSGSAGRVTGFALRTGQALPAHAAEADAFLLVTEGRARVTIGGAMQELAAGEGVTLPGTVQHAVEALSDLRMVLVRSR
jgi:quercetin dioxygenase-like cupin family protein